MTTSEKNDMSQLVRIQDDESHTLMVTLARGGRFDIRDRSSV